MFYIFKKATIYSLFVLIGMPIGAMLWVYLDAVHGSTPIFHTAEIVNESGMDITLITIEHDYGTTTHNGLKKNKAVSLALYGAEGNNHTIIVTFQNNHELQKIYHAYSEIGYIVRHTIFNSKIESERLSF